MNKIKSSFVIALILATIGGGSIRSAHAGPSSPAHAAVSAPELAETPTPSPSDEATPSKDKDGKRKKARNGAYEDAKRTYKEFIEKPSSIGIKPTESLYRNVYYKIHSNFVQELSDATIIKGIKAEVKNYLTQAKQPVNLLDKLSDDQTAGDAYEKVQELTKGHGNPDLIGYATIWGLIQSTRDTYSVLMTSDEYDKLKEQLQSKPFSGIGIYIEIDKEHGNELTVVEAIEGGPAAQAGLDGGDQILKVDGKPTHGITIEDAQKLIRGPEGSTVVLQISRKNQLKEVSIKRLTIHTPSVSHQLYDGNVGYIRLRTFGEHTAEELQKVVELLRKEGAQSLILDLRNNGGGYINAAVDVVGEFSPAKTLVVFTVDRATHRKEYLSGNTPGVSMPMVCMVNELSASASEITAGALLDNHTAKIVGDHSFGKGSVQQLYQLEPGFSDSGPHLKLTIARFYTPSGNVIDHKGIEPDVSIDMEPRYVGKAGQDVQLTKSIELLGGRPTLVPEASR